jgi:hypothetical protein
LTEWSQAESIDAGGSSVNTPDTEGCPIEALDGNTLYFASNRPGGQGGLDIWMVERKSRNHPWGVPVNLPAPVNSGVNDFCPTPLSGGRLFFVSTRGSECGSSADIFQTRHHPVHGWMVPESVGCKVNSTGTEFAPSLVERYGRTILFFSSDREGNQNIYMSEMGADGLFGAAVAVAELNSPFNDARPNIRRDGLEIVFDSDRNGGAPDIWTSSRANIDAPWSAPQPLGSNVNSASGESRASLSHDGKRLYFGSTRAASSDIYVSTRKVSGLPADLD